MRLIRDMLRRFLFAGLRALHFGLCGAVLLYFVFGWLAEARVPFRPVCADRVVLLLKGDLLPDYAEAHEAVLNQWFGTETAYRDEEGKLYVRPWIYLHYPGRLIEVQEESIETLQRFDRYLEEGRYRDSNRKVVRRACAYQSFAAFGHELRSEETPDFYAPFRPVYWVWKFAHWLIFQDQYFERYIFFPY